MPCVHFTAGSLHLPYPAGSCGVDEMMQRASDYPCFPVESKCFCAQLVLTLQQRDLTHILHLVTSKVHRIDGTYIKIYKINIHRL